MARRRRLRAARRTPARARAQGRSSTTSSYPITAADGAALLAPGTAAAARLPVMALRRESGAERAATVAGSRISLISLCDDSVAVWQRVGYAKVCTRQVDADTVL